MDTQTYRRTLIRVARHMVEMAKSQVNNQINAIETRVASEASKQVQKITSGIWIGKGADTFIEVINNEFTSRVNRILGQSRFMVQTLDHAVERINAADQQAASIASEAGEVFRNIF